MKAAVYCRLSKEDACSEGYGERYGESESIQNQKSLLVKYAVEQGWDVYDIYADDDYSGIDSRRPEFLRLLADAEVRRFDVVLCKTQSRFTRDLELVEHYIHGKFVEWGIRFVAVVDHVDTELRGNKKARQINGLMNEWYLEDLSENIRAVFDHKRRQGQYIGGFPLYGYVRDPADKHHLVPEPCAAAVVQRIFRLYLAGEGKQRIAQRLNAEGIPNPTKHKQLLGLGYSNGFAAGERGLWSRTAVGRILHERMYTGDLIQGKRRKPTYKSKHVADVPEEQWFITQNAHEPIIDRETFQTVQRMLGERTRSDGTGEVHPLGGKVRCMECKSTMAKVSHSTAHGCNSYLRCKLYAVDKSRCQKNVISLAALEECVLGLLREHLRQSVPHTDLERLAAREQKQRPSAVDAEQTRLLRRTLEQRVKAVRDLYLDKSAGFISAAQFLELNAGLQEERDALSRQLAAAEAAEAVSADGMDEAETNAILEQWLAIPALTRELAAEFIDFIEVAAPNPAEPARAIAIHWLF